MSKALKWMDEHFEETLLSVFLLGIVVFMTAHVFFRYVLKSPIVWTEELTRYLFIWFVFTGFSYGIKMSSHLRVNILEIYFPKLELALNVFQDFLTFVFIVYLIPAGIDVLKFFLRTGQTSPGLELPMIFVYGSLFIALIASLLRLIQKWFKLIKSRTFSREGVEK